MSVDQLNRWRDYLTREIRSLYHMDLSEARSNADALLKALFDTGDRAEPRTWEQNGRALAAKQ